MRQLTAAGQNLVNDLANRHGFSVDAVTHMLFAVFNGNGRMAQFNHGEFAGSGQWMRGGMIMLGDMFNNYLKGRVDSLCTDLSDRLANDPGLLQTGSFQSQSQGSGYQNQGSGARGNSSLFVPDPEDNWWPSELGSPNATGAQNNVKYAYFAGPCRLAVKTGGDVWVYDTQSHQIGGFSQQQGMGGSITFSSQFGTVNLSQLPVVSRNGQHVEPPAPPAASSWQSPVSSSPAPASAASLTTSEDVLATLEKLGALKSQGLLTEDEFAAKKAELLRRL